jgi:predicted metalloprotease with PDZ domain
MYESKMVTVNKQILFKKSRVMKCVKCIVDAVLNLRYTRLSYKEMAFLVDIKNHDTAGYHYPY